MLKGLCFALSSAVLATLVSGCCCSKDTPAKKAPEVKEIQKIVVSDSKLVNVVWVLQISSLKGTDPAWAKPGKPINFSIAPDGRVSGCAGVNRYFGPAEFSGSGKIAFKAIGATKMAGLGLKYENLYFDTLGKVDSYQILDGKLFLKSSGKTLAIFEPAK